MCEKGRALNCKIKTGSICISGALLIVCLLHIFIIYCGYKRGLLPDKKEGLKLSN